MDERFKVVTSTGTTVNAGEHPKGAPAPLGMTREAAEADAGARNQRATDMGIRTRYEVVPL